MLSAKTSSGTRCFIVANPRDTALQGYAGASATIVVFGSNTREVTSIYSVDIQGRLVRLARPDDAPRDFTSEPPDKPFQPELTMFEITDGLQGFATFKRVWCLIDASDTMVALTLSESVAKTMTAAGHKNAVRNEQHWCVELGGKHYGLTGTEPLEFDE